MTPAEEARFITLWNAGTETAAMAQQLGIPHGHRGWPMPRPWGSSYLNKSPRESPP
jgi:hypothetical protein